MSLLGREKATILLSVLGNELSERVLKYLPAEVADTIVSGLDQLPTPSSEAVAEILGESRRFIMPEKKLAEPLETPPDKTEALPSGPEAAVPSLENPPFAEKGKPSSLSQASAAALSSLLLYERPQLAAFLLSRFGSERQAEVLSYLPGQREEIEKLLLQVVSNSFSEELFVELDRFFTEKV